MGERLSEVSDGQALAWKTSEKKEGKTGLQFGRNWRDGAQVGVR